ncbi:magnesium transporter [Formosa sp. Hel1_31_208]|uniref:magnesium/cobalt transporter CorA n=1 Tax=Formosa sp. Hel1_31_208 TaxID=1798225 RepID=UPI00087A9150|nr:magnesium/cobalt transporter CorA [Formosa sp. Hel1_31_208]SDS35837.1 magnesium transporter [Formosa sp. Hel1_31_208]
MVVKKKNKKSYKAHNLPPGTMAYRGKKQTAITDIEIINYSKDHYKSFNSKQVEDAFDFKGTDHVTWININGLNNISDIETLGLHYNLHPLTLEDIVNTSQRPKIEEFENYLFVVFKMLFIKNDDELHYEHVSLIVGEDYVLTFQEADGDVFNDLRERLKLAKGRIRTQGSDYLMYTLLDAIVDNYFTVIEVFGDRIEDLESLLFQARQADDSMPNQIQQLKREILKMRRSIYPLREVINRMEKTNCVFIEEKTTSYLRDLYDHIIQVNESVDLYREMIWSLMDMYMTIISNKMNEIMKVLTIIATIFIPLTFIAGIYGMNFKNMPELNSNNGYFILLGVMFVLLIFMLIYFRRKRWL